MRVKYKDLVIECEWVVRHKNYIVFGTKSKEVFYTEFVNDMYANQVLGEIVGKGCLRANNLGVVRCFYIDKVSDLLCANIFENAVFDPTPGGAANSAYCPL